MSSDTSRCDLLIVGGGHAGCEAAWAALRMGCRVGLVTMQRGGIATMPCNPAVGGLAKGHVVKEIDALGGLMGWMADRACIQFRLLNRSRGPAVRGPRAQCDKALYAANMQEFLSGLEGLEIIEAEAAGLLLNPSRDRVEGLALADGRELRASCVILTTGTFLDGLIHRGEERERAGRIGERAALPLAAALAGAGLETLRLKTGTPPRLLRDSIDWSAFEVQPPDLEPEPFSWRTERFTLPQLPCHVAYTNEAVHAVIRANMHRSPLYSGAITGIGPRYCPSIEDKVVKFAGKPRHQVFLEPEGLGTDWIYLNGLSTSMPREVQESFVHAVPGLEEARFARHGYAVEYCAVQPTELWPTLETKRLQGLFCAGQINGTSGYEEAAGQGLAAGVNAALRALRGDAAEPFVLHRGEAYIGVMVDDLVTKGVSEPYRLLTSRAEHRLLLSADTAEERLLPHARCLGLLPDERLAAVTQRCERIAAAGRILEKTVLRPSEEARRAMREAAGLDFTEASSLQTLLRRPEARLETLKPFLPGGLWEGLTSKERGILESRVKYEGYVTREKEEMERLRRRAATRIPPDFRYEGIPGLSREAAERLGRVRPRDIGQAGRVPGVTPAALSILSVRLRRGAAGVPA
jgi:tRNA uridine 5-carboxymethylaminomethyl modification enzyme